MMAVRTFQFVRRMLIATALMVVACVPRANASATLLLEEPYGHLGFFTATGHAAVYLSGVCAETPVRLRPCRPGETGVVISRYDGVAGYDWVAIPLVPYLYAVDRPEDVPLFADAKMVAFLRDHYRRKYLEQLVPDAESGATPKGNWYELIGSSYDRAIYGFEIDTTREQDAALIRKLNESPNVSHFHMASNNCADFAKHIINFYYPRALHRSVIADVGMTTPKQMAKMLTRFSDHHPSLQFSRTVIAQVPGSMPRSSAVHGVVESFFKSGKYIVPSAVVSPIFAGCVAAVYVGTGAGRFEPGRNAMVYVVGDDREPPVGKEDRRAYQLELKHLLAGAYPETPGRKVEKDWSRLQEKAEADVDDQGRPVLRMQLGQQSVVLGASAENLREGNAPPQLVQQLLEARLESELQKGAIAKISEREIERDWELLQATMGNETPTTDRASQHAENLRGIQ